MLFVHKYGGTSLADARRLDRAARRSVELARQGHRLVLVVSAQGDHTDRMIEKAAQTAACPVPGRWMPTWRQGSRWRQG